VTAWSFLAAIGLFLLPGAAAASLNDPAVRGDCCLSDSLTIWIILLAFVTFRNFRRRTQTWTVGPTADDIVRSVPAGRLDLESTITHMASDAPAGAVD
jgi:hypothetical protein